VGAEDVADLKIPLKDKEPLVRVLKGFREFLEVNSLCIELVSFNLSV